MRQILASMVLVVLLFPALALGGEVKFEDLVETDGMFTVLMGDQVEPRRQFIEKNALRVKNLDV